MAQIFPYLAPIAIAVVAIVLAAGLWNMMRGGSSNRSQNLMRLRVLSQAVAVVILVATVYFAGR